jgi:hypothetical protein
VAEVEAKIAAHVAAMPVSAIDPVELGLLASNLKTISSAPTTDVRLKKRIVRTIIHEVVADTDDAAAEIILVVHWVGGVHFARQDPVRRGCARSRGGRHRSRKFIAGCCSSLIV